MTRDCRGCNGKGWKLDPVAAMYLRRWIEDGRARFDALLNEEQNDG